MNKNGNLNLNSGFFYDSIKSSVFLNLYEESIHIDQCRLDGITLVKDYYFIDQSLITNGEVLSTATLDQNKKYIKEIFLMYDLGNELTFLFTWGLNIFEN